jgi:hypothetical protein
MTSCSLLGERKKSFDNPALREEPLDREAGSGALGPAIKGSVLMFAP